MATIAQLPQPQNDLKKDCLSYPEVIAQSISVIAPSTVPAAVLGLIFVSAGNGTWLSFLLGTIGLLFVSFNINQFARRSASPGSLYTYIVKGLGPTAGVLSGWGLLLGYMLTGMSTLCGFAIFSRMLLLHLGTLSSFGFLLVYILVSVAAPMYLRSIGNLRKIDVFYSLMGGGFMLLPLLGLVGIPGNKLFPPPSFPSNLLVWIFIAYMAVGLVWLLIQKARSPEMIPTMKTSMDEIDLKFSDVKNV